LKQHQAAQDGPWKTSFGTIDEAGREAIAEFLQSRVGAPQLVAAKALFHSLGCRGCHKIGGVGGDDGPDLTLAGDKDPGRLDFTHVPGEPTIANWHAAHLRQPAQIVPGSQMPNLNLSDEQVDLLTFYLLSLRRSSFPEAYWPKDRIRAERFGEREFSGDGATLYGTFCAACHGLAGEGKRYPNTPPFPALANADFLAAATNEFLTASIRKGRPGRRMPAWGEKDGGLRPEEIAAIVGYLRQRTGTPEPQPTHPEPRWVKADPAVGQPLYTRYCAGCHGAKGEGLQAPQLNNPGLLAVAPDSYLLEAIARGRRGTPMPSFRHGSPTNPALAETELEAIVAFIRTWETKTK
jgi:mono/diheme cytochrome c family protein